MTFQRRSVLFVRPRYRRPFWTYKLFSVCGFCGKRTNLLKSCTNWTSILVYTLILFSVKSLSICQTPTILKKLITYIVLFFRKNDYTKYFHDVFAKFPWKQLCSVISIQHKNAFTEFCDHNRWLYRNSVKSYFTIISYTPLTLLEKYFVKSIYTMHRLYLKSRFHGIFVKFGSCNILQRSDVIVTIWRNFYAVFWKVLIAPLNRPLLSFQVSCLLLKKDTTLLRKPKCLEWTSDMKTSCTQQK